MKCFGMHICSDLSMRERSMIPMSQGHDILPQFEEICHLSNKMKDLQEKEQDVWQHTWKDLMHQEYTESISDCNIVVSLNEEIDFMSFVSSANW